MACGDYIGDETDVLLASTAQCTALLAGTMPVACADAMHQHASRKVYKGSAAQLPDAYVPSQECFLVAAY